MAEQKILCLMLKPLQFYLKISAVLHFFFFSCTEYLMHHFDAETKILVIFCKKKKKNSAAETLLTKLFWELML